MHHPHGISAVLLPGEQLEPDVLDLAAVLVGLVSENFEIVVVAHDAHFLEAAAELRAGRPGLPLRVVEGESLANGFAAARFDLIFVAASDGQFDVRELNHVFDAATAGADVSVGYRPRRTDGVTRQLQRWGWDADVDCAFSLLRRDVLRHVAGRNQTSCAGLVRRARRQGFQVVDVPVSHRRPVLNAQSSALNAVITQH